MERLRKNEPDWTILTARGGADFYGAFSIADLNSGGTQVLRDKREILAAWTKELPLPIRGVIFVGSIPRRLGNRLLGREFDPVTSSGAVVLVPNVRHTLERETSQDPNVFTIFDNTGECKVNMPDLNWRLVMKRKGWPPVHSPDAYKNQSWQSNVLLYTIYDKREGNNIFTLVSTLDKDIPEQEKTRLLNTLWEL